MRKPKNTKELFEYVKKVEKSAGNLQVHCGTVWNLGQLMEEIVKCNKYDELIKVEVHNRNPGFKEQWDYMIYAYPTEVFSDE